MQNAHTQLHCSSTCAPACAQIVVNLQTMQLMLYYHRLMTSELRLVALNQIFERAPVEAQMLLTYTYIVEEVCEGCIATV